jgi:hypothetical protein
VPQPQNPYQVTPECAQQSPLPSSDAIRNTNRRRSRGLYSHDVKRSSEGKIRPSNSVIALIGSNSLESVQGLPSRGTFRCGKDLDDEADQRGVCSSTIISYQSQHALKRDMLVQSKIMTGPSRRTTDAERTVIQNKYVHLCAKDEDLDEEDEEDNYESNHSYVKFIGNENN